MGLKIARCSCLVRTNRAVQLPKTRVPFFLEDWGRTLTHGGNPTNIPGWLPRRLEVQGIIAATPHLVRVWSPKREAIQ